MKYILFKEYEFEGQKYTELELDLDFCSFLAAKAAKDYCGVAQEVGNFLLG